MNLRFAVWLTLLTLFVLGLIGVVGVALAIDLDPPQRGVLRALLKERLPLLIILALMLPLLLGALLRWWMWAYPIAAARMAEEVTLIQTVNPRHRVALTGGREMRLLGDAVNALAAVHEQAGRQVQARVDEANARLE